MLGEQIANLPIGSVGLGTIKVVGKGVDPPVIQVSRAKKVYDSHRPQSRITLRNSSPRNPTIMLYINHAFEQRTNLATTIEIE